MHRPFGLSEVKNLELDILDLERRYLEHSKHSCSKKIHLKISLRGLRVKLREAKLRELLTGD